MLEYTTGRMIVFFAILFVFHLTTESTNDATTPKKKKPLRILMIGDSNTEIGNITLPLKKLLDSAYGNYGTGYSTLNPNCRGKMSDSLSFHYDSSWSAFDMRNDFKPEPPPYYSPDGLSIASSTPGATATISFYGNQIDIFYLQYPQAARFSVNVDGTERVTRKEDAFGTATKKLSSAHLPTANHKLVIKVISGKLILLGVDAQQGNKKNKERSVLHKWGNAWSSCGDFLNIDSTVFSTALRLLNPNKVVLLLGTNDHNLDHRNPNDFKTAQVRLINRIKKAIPSASILVVSTFATNTPEAHDILPAYISRSFPAASSETNSFYWDMSTWFGPYDPEKLPDGVHVNELYGGKIAAELFRRLN